MSTVIRERVEAPPVVTVRDVLHRAADLLEEFGWCQRALARDADGDALMGFDGRPCGAVAFCELGAMVQAGVDYGIKCSDLYFNYSGRWGSREERMRFNDAPGRTKAEVVAHLREAAEASS